VDERCARRSRHSRRTRRPCRSSIVRHDGAGKDRAKLSEIMTWVLISGLCADEFKWRFARYRRARRTR
jgi:hypothetical protein